MSSETAEIHSFPDISSAKAGQHVVDLGELQKAGSLLGEHEAFSPQTLPSGGRGRLSGRASLAPANGSGPWLEPRDCTAHHMFVRQGRAKGGPLMVLNLAVQAGDRSAVQSS